MVIPFFPMVTDRDTGVICLKTILCDGHFDQWCEELYWIRGMTFLNG